VYKFRNNETNKELRPITPQCKCGLTHTKFCVLLSTVSHYKLLTYSS